MKLRDLKRARHLGWRDIANKGGIFASFLLVTVLSLYAWSPAGKSSAFDWSNIAGGTIYSASLSGSSSVTIQATPSASQQVFTSDDTLNITSTCPYSAAVKLNMSSNSSDLSRTGSDSGVKAISATTGDSLVDNSWGYSIDSGTSYHAVPLSNATPVTLYTSSGIISNEPVNIKYGMQIDSSIPSGTYSSDVVYTLTVSENCTKYNLVFNTDGGSAISPLELTYGQTVNLIEHTTSRADANFLGWEDVDTGDLYTGKETNLNINPTNRSTVTLKAKWQILGTTFDGITTMQEMTYSVCQNETTPYTDATVSTYDHTRDRSLVPTATLLDTRDGNIYVVKKLADGQCWMTENLKLMDKTISSLDSDLGPNMTYTVPASDDSASFTGNIDTDKARLAWAYDSRRGEYYQSGYYNFYTATAGTGGTNLSSGDSIYSICPKGWRLPTTGGGNSELDNDYGKLYSIYNTYSSISGEPANFVQTGSFSGTTFSSAGSWWTSYIAGSNRTLYMYAGYSSGWLVVPWSGGYYDNKNEGYTIRCIASGERYVISFDAGEGTVSTSSAVVTNEKPSELPIPLRAGYAFDGWYTSASGGTFISDSFTAWDTLGYTTLYAHWSPTDTIHDLTNMQEMTVSACQATTTPSWNATEFDTDGSHLGDTSYIPKTTLNDARDSNSYAIVKLPDGKCWMADDLKLIDATITSTNSDLAGGDSFTVPESSTRWDMFYGYGPPETYLSDGHVYYNLYAAAAVTGGQGSDYLEYDMQREPHSICPTGWRLPTGGTGGDFDLLYGSGAYSTSAKVKAALSITPTGYLGDYGDKKGTSNGYYWSSTIKDTYNAYELNVGNSSYNDGTATMAPYRGLSVRCVVNDKKLTTISMMQEMTPRVCENTPIGSSATLSDPRDWSYYSVKKLKDGNCWMTQNLRISFESIDSNNTNLVQGEYYDIPSSNISNFTTDIDKDAAYIDDTYGGYYSFYTATAGTGGMSLTSGNAPADICPKGWRLPTGGEGGEFLTLYDNYSSKALLQGDPGLILSGNALNGSLVNQGAYGYFWSSTVYNANRAYYLYLGSSLVDPASNYNKYYGFPVRCVAR